MRRVVPVILCLACCGVCMCLCPSHLPLPLRGRLASMCAHWRCLLLSSLQVLALSITVLFASVGRSQVPCSLLAITSAGHVQQCQRPLPHQVRGWRLHSRADHPRRKGLRRERLEEERPLFRNTLAGFNLNLLARRSIGGDKKAVAAVSIYLYSTAAGSSHVAASSVEPT